MEPAYLHLERRVDVIRRDSTPEPSAQLDVSRVLFRHMDQANIRFATDEWYDHHRRKVVWFSAWIDGERVDCGVSIEAIADHFGAYYDEPLPAFRANRERIQAVATKLILSRRVENDGTIVIRSADL